MKKTSGFKLQNLTQIKIFLLSLLDSIRYPIDYTTLTKILIENIEELRIDYEESLRELADAGHLLFDDLDGEKYYMISETGRTVASELYETIDPELRESSLKCAAKYISLSGIGASIYSRIEPTDDKRFIVTLGAKDDRCEFFSLSLVTASRSEAERIRAQFEDKPDAFYRSILFCATGKFEFLN